jgi:single-strand DNA-binding protein
MLKVICLGHVGADPEERYTQKGAPMTQFRMAVNQVRTDRDGERQETTEWFQIRAMGTLAERAQRLSKGDRVLVIGRLTVTHFQSRDGEPRTGFDVWADEVTSVSLRPTSNTTEKTTRQTAPEANSENLEDLPF